MSNGLNRKGYVHRDSMEVCDYPSDLFYTIRNPSAPPRPASAAPVKVDTIESVQKKIELEAQHKLQSGTSIFASESLRFVARLGKLLFMTVMLPPYFFLYAMPKFVVVVALPRFFFFVTRPFKKAVQKINDKIVTLYSKFQKVLKFMGIGKKDEQRKKSEISLLQRLANPFVVFYSKTVDLVLAPYRFVQNLRQKVRTAVRNRIQQSKNAVLGAIRSVNTFIAGKIKEAGRVLHRAFIQPVADRVKPKVEAFKEACVKTVRKAVESVTAIRDATVSFLKDPLLNLSHAWSKVATKVVDAATTINAAAVDRAKREIRELAEVMRVLQAKTYDLVTDRYQLAKGQVQAWATVSKQVVKETAVFLWNSAVQTPQKIWSIVAKKPTSWLRHGRHWTRQQYQQHQDALKSVIRRGVESLKGNLRRAYTEAKGILKKWLGAIWIKLRIVPQLALTAAKVISRHVISMMKKTVHMTRVSWAWSKVLFRCGMQMVREAAQEIIAVLSRKLG